jgi:hypothetical protein
MERPVGRVTREIVESVRSGLSFVLRRNSVLEIQDCNIRAGRDGVCEAVGAGCRREQLASNTDWPFIGHGLVSFMICSLALESVEELE